MLLSLLRREALVTALLFALGACNGSEPNVPTALTLDPATVSFTALDQTQQLTASVADQNGNPLDANVTWTSSNNAVATVNSAGLVTATGAGTAQVTAAAGSAEASAQVSVTQTPTQLTKISGDGQTAPVGQTVPAPLVVEVGDALGNPVPGVVVVFAIAQGGGSVNPTSATTGADGRASTTFTTGPLAATPQQVSASIPATAIAVSFTAITVAGAPASISLAAGNNQHAAAGTAVPVRPAVVVRDAGSNPIAGVAVEFEVVSGGGSITGGSTVTDVSGRAAVGSWTLGSAGANVLRATAAGTGIDCNPVTFAASTVITPFEIEVRFLGCTSANHVQAFTTAEQKWESLVVGDLVNLPMNEGAESCDTGTPAITETVDDVIIFATIRPIDGVGGVLGQAGPCFVRDPSFLPLVGVMFFDSEDLEFVEGEDLLEELTIHEMAHVLGFGTLWPFQGLLADAASGGGVDPHFTGAQALAAFNTAGGSGYAGAKVPVEDQGGPGTADSHWRESVFDTELMTGFVNLGTNPLSAITVAALADQGFTVDDSEADPYTVAPALRVAGERKGISLKNDIRRLPVKVVDSKGRLIRMLRR
jgi:hypothetical protein